MIRQGFGETTQKLKKLQCNFERKETILFTNIVFDQYQRYKTLQLIVEKLREVLGKESFKILEVGANRHNMLQKFLPDDELACLDIFEPEELIADVKYYVGDATYMPEFKNCSFDLVVALDVLEHINASKRRMFINEISRVSKIAAVICFPFEALHNLEVDKQTNTFYLRYSGTDHEWLLEHMKYGLPNRSLMESWLKELGLAFHGFEHGCVHMWEAMLSSHFQAFFAQDAVRNVFAIDEYYNKNIFDKDISMKNYRAFYVFGKSPSVSIAAKKAENCFFGKASSDDWIYIYKTQYGNFLSKEKSIMNSLNWYKEVSQKRLEHIEHQDTVIVELRQSLEWHKDLSEKRLEHIEHQDTVMVELRQSLEWHKNELRNVLESFSWKITKFIRTLAKFIKRKDRNRVSRQD